MKYFQILLILFSINTYGQTDLKFDKKFVQAVDNWVAFPAHSTGNHSFGFIYIDSQTGLTLDYNGSFKIDNYGKYILKKKEVDGAMKYRLEPNNTLVAFISEQKLKELEIERIPDWLKFYKDGEETVERLYQLGYMYNGWNECEKALTYLEKADKVDPKFKGLQTELAFSYNASGKFDKAEIALKKAIKENPTDCYTHKELAYTYTKIVNFKKVAETYLTMTKICTQQNFIQETAHNLSYEYFKIKDKVNFKKWKAEAEKWSKSENQYTKNLNKMEAEFEK